MSIEESLPVDSYQMGEYLALDPFFLVAWVRLALAQDYKRRSTTFKSTRQLLTGVHESLLDPYLNHRGPVMEELYQQMAALDQDGYLLPVSDSSRVELLAELSNLAATQFHFVTQLSRIRLQRKNSQPPLEDKLSVELELESRLQTARLREVALVMRLVEFQTVSQLFISFCQRPVTLLPHESQRGLGIGHYRYSSQLAQFLSVELSNYGLVTTFQFYRHLGNALLGRLPNVGSSWIKLDGLAQAARELQFPSHNTLAWLELLTVGQLLPNYIGEIGEV